MKKYAYLLSIIGFIFNTYTFTSCVSAKKYQALEAEHQKTIIEEKAAKNQLDREKATLEQYEKTIASLKSENNKLSEEVMNRANAGSIDIQNLQKKVKSSNDSLVAYKEFHDEQKNRWQNTQDSLEQNNTKLKNEIKEINAETNRLKVIWTEKIEKLESDVERSEQKQKELTIQLKNSNDEKEILLEELKKLTGGKKLQAKLNPEDSLSNANKIELGRDLAYYFLSVENNNAKLLEGNENYIIEIDEIFLFGTNGKMNDKNGIDFLNDFENIMKKHKSFSLLVETIGTSAEDRPQKAELVRKHLADSGLNASSSPKNFMPVAFDTSRESIRKTKIYIK